MGKGLNSRRVNSLFRSRISSLMLFMIATFASVYVIGRLWQDAQNRAYLVKELDRVTGQGKLALSLDDSFKITDCREQRNKLQTLEMELAAAKQEGYVSVPVDQTDGKYPKKKALLVLGILTSFGRRKEREAVRKAWMGTGSALKKMEDEKAIVVRFVIGKSANGGDSLDWEIDVERKQTNDFIILKNHEETSEALPRKTMLFFAHVADNWDADLYAKANDDIYVNIGMNLVFTIKLTYYREEDPAESFRSSLNFGTTSVHLLISDSSFFSVFSDALGNTLAAHVNKPRVYIGCMKSGEVFSESNQKWYEPDWWKFGDGKSYFRHASGEIFVISQALAKFVSINRSNLRTYAHDDVSVGSWFIGLDVQHINEKRFCCSWSSGAICSGV